MKMRKNKASLSFLFFVILTFALCAIVAVGTFALLKNSTSPLNNLFYAGNVFRLEYDLNGGTGDIPAESKTGGHLVTSRDFTVTDQAPTREGFAFLGWADSAEATEVTYTAGDTVSVNAGETKILYALWEAPVKYRLILNANGGSIKYIDGAGSTVDFASAAGEGQLFASQGEVDQYTFTSMSCADASANGLSLFTSASENGGLGTYRAAVTVTYTLAGWSTDPYATPGAHNLLPVGLSSYTVQDSAALDAEGYHSVTLYAVWEVHANYVLYFDANLDAPFNNGAVPPQTQYALSSEPSHTFSLADTAMANISYGGETLCFSGWAESPDADTPQYTTADSIILTMPEGATHAEKTLYAVWLYDTERTYTLRFNASGGTDSIPPPPRPSYPGRCG